MTREEDEERDSWEESRRNRWRFGGGRVLRIVGMVVGGLALAVVAAFVFGWFVMLLWNWLMPVLFHVVKITFWQAFGIIILAKLIFSPFGSGPKHPPSAWRHFKGRDWDDVDWKPNGSHRNWRYYGRYWNEEGKAHFESWLDRQEEPKTVSPKKSAR